MGCGKFTPLKQNDIASGDNGLTYSPNTSDLTKTDTLQLYLCQNDENVR